MKLLIISHTEHFYRSDGQIVGLGPTVREINHLSRAFDVVTHIGVLYKKGVLPKGFIPYEHSNIHFVGIPPFGGKNFMAKLRILLFALTIMPTVIKALRKADIFQFRAPTSIGVFLIPLLTLFNGKKGWYKYAGNWAQRKPPLSYAFQRWWLKHMQKRKVTINGAWPNLPGHCLSFENPCLEEEDIKRGEQIRKHKSYDTPLTLCFVGRIEEAKGVTRILKALSNHPHLEWFKVLHMIGDGPERSRFERMAKKIPLSVIFHGSLNRQQVFEIYQQSHMLLLPSDSEGFPKVIAEAANFGCIPVVSDISSISQYISNDRGYLWRPNQETFPEFFRRIDLNNESLTDKTKHTGSLAKSFSYTHYVERIKDEIL